MAYGQTGAGKTYTLSDKLTSEEALRPLEVKIQP